MNKDLNFSVLLDFYGNMLTVRQQSIMNGYYNEDLSLSEIADEIGITRQGVRDAIKKSESILIKTEESLGLAGRFKLISAQLEEIKNLIINSENPEKIVKMIDEINI